MANAACYKMPCIYVILFSANPKRGHQILSKIRTVKSLIPFEWNCLCFSNFTIKHPSGKIFNLSETDLCQNDVSVPFRFGVLHSEWANVHQAIVRFATWIMKSGPFIWTSAIGRFSRPRRLWNNFCDVGRPKASFADLIESINGKLGSSGIFITQVFPKGMCASSLWNDSQQNDKWEPLRNK